MDTMHFCPRPSCRRFFHDHCLVKYNLIEPDTVLPTRAHRITCCSPDVDDAFILTDLFDLSSHGPTQSHRTLTQKSTAALLTQDINTLLASFQIPSPLLSIAQQPIIKGYRVTSVVGNTRPVIEARRMVYRAVGHLNPIPDDWEEAVGGPVLDDSAIRVILPFMCPQCWSPI